MTTWWPTTWGRLLPGDLIQAPNGTTWTVGAALVDSELGEWCITSGGKSAWTPHALDEPVQASRPMPLAPASTAEAEIVLGRLRLAFGDVMPVASDDDGTGTPFLRCGQRKCACGRW